MRHLDPEKNNMEQNKPGTGDNRRLSTRVKIAQTTLNYQNAKVGQGKSSECFAQFS
jgi:hypothetical protein